MSLAPRKVKIEIMGGLPGLETAFRETFTDAVTTRCWVNSTKNVLNKCPARLREAFKALLGKVMYADIFRMAETNLRRLRMIWAEMGN